MSTATNREPREELIVELLKNNWNAPDTFDLTPKISYGWFEEDQSKPQVTVPLPEEGPIDGGDTGYASMSGDGSGPSQQIGGESMVHLWARATDVTGATGSGQNPRRWLSYAREMVYSIIRDNANQPSNPSSGNQPVNYVSCGEALPAHDADRSPTVFHLVVPVMFGYGPT